MAGAGLADGFRWSKWKLRLVCATVPLGRRLPKPQRQAWYSDSSSISGWGMMLTGTVNPRGLACSRNAGGASSSGVALSFVVLALPPALQLPATNAGPPGQALRLRGVPEVVRAEGEGKERWKGRGGWTSGCVRTGTIIGVKSVSPAGTRRAAGEVSASASANNPLDAGPFQLSIAIQN